MDFAEQERTIALIGESLFAVWASTSLTAASMLGGTIERIGRPLARDSAQVASQAASWAKELSAMHPAEVGRGSELARRFLSFELSNLAEAASLRPFDLQITPYRIGPTLGEVNRYMSSFAFAIPADLDRYAALAEQYRDFLRGTLQNLKEQ